MGRPARRWLVLHPVARIPRVPSMVEFLWQDPPWPEAAQRLALLRDAYLPVIPPRRGAHFAFDAEAEQDSDFAARKVLSVIARGVAGLGPGYGLRVPDLRGLDDHARDFVALVERFAEESGLAPSGLAPSGLALSIGEGVAPLDDPMAQAVRDGAPFPLTGAEARAAAGTLRACGHTGSTGFSWPDGALARVLMPLAGPGLRGRLRRVALGPARWRLARFDWLRTVATLSGPDHLFDLYLDILPVLEAHGRAREAALARLQAARLAPRIGRPDGFARAIALHEQVFASPALDADERLDVGQQLANIHAVRATPDHLAVADRLYGGLRAAPLRETASRRRVMVAVRVENGLALVRYRRGDMAGAEAHEAAALAIAERFRGPHPDLRDWARRLVQFNLATLRLRGLGDVDGAIALMEDGGSDASTVVDLARLYLCRGDRARARGILQDRFAGAADFGAVTDKDLYGVAALALLLLGQDGQDGQNQQDGQAAQALIARHAHEIRAFGSDVLDGVIRFVGAWPKQPERAATP